MFRGLIEPVFVLVFVILLGYGVNATAKPAYTAVMLQFSVSPQDAITVGLDFDLFFEPLEPAAGAVE